MWWVAKNSTDPTGYVVLSAASKADYLKKYGPPAPVAGPFATAKAADAWIAAHPGGSSGAGGWFVISVPTSARGTSRVLVSQKPFPVGATEVSGPYATKAAAQKAAAKTGQGITPPRIHLPNPLSGIDAIGGFFSALSDPHTWLRVGEVTIGIVLLAVGINAVLKQTTGTSPVQVIGKVADKVPKVIPV